MGTETNRQRRDPVIRRPLVHAQRGQGLVEMAMVVMLLLVLVFGIIDFGIYFYRHIQAANCVREAARRAAVRDADAASPPYCIDASLAPTLTAGYMDLAAGDEVEATINTSHDWLVLDQVIPGLDATIPITAATSMRMEGQVTT